MKVVITGSSSGIGKATALEFLKRGHQVIGIDKKGPSIQEKNYTHCQVDITRDELPSIPDVEILVHSAGVQEEEEAIDVNLKGTIRVNEEYAFQERIHSVVFIASSSASNGAEFPDYAASKGGVVTYMKYVASKIAKYHATSNSLSPGGVTTDLNKHILESKELYEAVLNETLLHAWATAEEIAQWAYFVTVINRSMTAQDILIDNGEQAKFNFIW